jgi:DNA invertase Pin-like site-specific DNA recombinase
MYPSSQGKFVTSLQLEAIADLTLRHMQVQNMLDNLHARVVNFRSLTEAIDIARSTSRAMLQMIGVLAELERSSISERREPKDKRRCIGSPRP